MVWIIFTRKNGEFNGNIFLLLEKIWEIFYIYTVQAAINSLCLPVELVGPSTT